MSAKPATDQMAADKSVVVLPATAERWPDVDATFGGAGAHACWCMAYRLSGGDPRNKSFDGRRAHLRELTEQQPPPGMLAYIDGEVAGWCGFGPRPSLPRLERSRTIPKIDDKPVWSILCFNIRAGFRRRGVAGALLDGVIEFARRSGAPGVEGYPIDPESERVNSSFGYVGLTSMFERRGFRRVVQTDAHSDHRPRWLMRLDF
jgi:GNAT superfamily N-acetyltransferase